ncbi:hypothetical protein [Mycobacterium sp.]|uniref:hypothetical protein n=1 Tax=Mycobacterium sp. TaxID=1785 RepID=UPI0031E0247D
MADIDLGPEPVSPLPRVHAAGAFARPYEAIRTHVHARRREIAPGVITGILSADECDRPLPNPSDDVALLNPAFTAAKRAGFVVPQRPYQGPPVSAGWGR